MESYDEKKAIPHGKSSGGQEGVLDPGRRIYNANYEAVSLEEATRRAMMRSKGTLDIIKGGVTDNDPSLALSANKSTNKHKKQSAIAKRKEIADLAKPPESFDDYDSFSDPVPKVDKPIEISNTYNKIDIEDLADRISKKVIESKKEYKEPVPLFENKILVTIELQDTTLMIPAISVLDDEYSITVLFKNDGKSMMFVPKPGSSLKVNGKECYYPGSKFKMDDLSIFGLCMIKNEAN